MRKLTRSLLATTAVVGLLAIPVAGATASSNEVSFTVASGSTLSVTNSDAAVDADGGTALPFAVGDRTVSAALPDTTITDQRGTIGGTWTVTVASTGDWVRDNTDGLGDHTVDRSNGHVYLGVDGTGDALLGTLSGMTVSTFEAQVGVNDLSSNADAGYTLIAGTTLVGSGTTVYTPEIDITIPGDTPAGEYSATVTQTIS